MTTARITRAELYRRLALLPGILAGSSPDIDDTARRLLLAVGVEALNIVSEAYLVKSFHGTDAAGIRWKPLSPKYIAYTRRHPALSRRRAYAAKVGRQRRPLLTAAQDRLWRQVFARNLTRLRAAGDAEAAGHAAAIAWATVKRAGGRTILGTYGNTVVEIGRDTGRLFASLSPGNPDNILEPAAGSVRVGTNVKYAEHFHARRPLWADGDKWPVEWQERLGNVLKDGLAQLAARVVEDGA